MSRRSRMTTMSTEDGGANKNSLSASTVVLRNRGVMVAGIIRVLWRLLYRHSTCTPYRPEYSRLRFRQYRLRLYQFLRWRRREHRSLGLRRHCRLHFFYTPNGSPFPRTSSWWGLHVICLRSRACRSVSLGRATAVGMDGSPGLGERQGVGG